MNLQEIEKMLEKYFNGESSLDEEILLQDFFLRIDLPKKFSGLKLYFEFTRNERARGIMDPAFDQKLLKKIEEPRLAKLLDIRRPWIYWASGVAASVLILIAVFVKFDPFTHPVKDTYQDPKEAYVEATKVLLYVAEKLNKGTSRLEPVARFETGLQNLKPVTAYDKGLSDISRLDHANQLNN